MSSIKSSLLILISVNLIQMNNGAVMTKTTAPTVPVTLPVTTSSGGPASGGPVFTKTTKGAVMTKTTGASNIKTTVPLSGSCKTGYGNNCRFPFIYAGKTYTTCTNVDYGNTFWCATSIRSNGQARTFDVCTPSCPHESVVRDPNCATVLGKACIFPSRRSEQHTTPAQKYKTMIFPGVQRVLTQIIDLLNMKPVTVLVQLPRRLNEPSYRKNWIINLRISKLIFFKIYLLCTNQIHND
ncbi:uncharacterized protein [Lepeophtheirus salmonis]|uniref:uncharacterized protein n=1 Tax=Lepeophtheirus salmonis TaxID=72036 RepID=UPI001AE1F8AF|nr:uncharacterized protein LOC121124114 [Lepeophtheirus salmonis]